MMPVGKPWLDEEMWNILNEGVKVRDTVCKQLYVDIWVLWMHFVMENIVNVFLLLV